MTVLAVFPINSGVINGTPVPFIVKLDANGNILWLTNGTRSSPTDIVINGNEVAISGGAHNLQWQNLTYQQDTDSGGHPYLARFNKDTGAIIAINGLYSTSNDMGTAIATDSKGNYYLGGGFSSSLTAGADILASGGYSDFFVAKFGSDNCDFLATNQVEKKLLKVYPNPVKDFLYVDHAAKSSYVLYDVVGKVVQAGTLDENEVIDVEALAKGMYLLRISGVDGVDVVKVLRE